MTTQIFARVSLRLLGVYFVVCGSPIILVFFFSFFEVPGLSVTRQDVAIHHTYFVAPIIQPPPITAITYLICGVILIAASRRFSRWLLRGIDSDDSQRIGTHTGRI